LFHFSGIDVEDESQLSKHCSRYRLKERQDLVPLFADYRERVSKMGYQEFKHRPYGFGSFSDGRLVTQIARTAFAISEQAFPADDPFSTESHFYKWARSRRVVGGADTSAQYSRASYELSPGRVRIANKLLTTLLRTVGPNRYTILMKYLSFISVLRNQPGVLSPE
ncbi:MAG: group 1 glycosyl transferase, partial [Candidatus Sulfotelmatobacter sp.]